MGATGPGTFEDDSAYMYFGVVEKRLLKDIEDCFLAHEQGQLDLSLMNYMLMPSMDILITLCEHYSVSLMLEAEKVRIWKQISLMVYDSVIDRHAPRSSYKTGRRKVIEETFDKIEELCLIGNEEKDSE